MKMVLVSLDNDKSALDTDNYIVRDLDYWQIEPGAIVSFGYNFDRPVLEGRALELWQEKYPMAMPECRECIYAHGINKDQAIARIVKARLENEMYLGDLHVGQA